MTQRIATVTANFQSGYAYSGIGINVRNNGSTNASKILLISTGTGPKLTVFKDGGMRLSSNVSNASLKIFEIDDKIEVKKEILREYRDLSSEKNTHDTAYAEDHAYIRSANGQVILNLANATTFHVESATNTITSLAFVKPDDTFYDKDRTYSCTVMFRNVSVANSVWTNAGIVWLDCIPPVTNANTTFVNFYSSESLSQAGLNSVWFGTGNSGAFDGISGGGTDGSGLDGDTDCLMIVIEDKLYAIPMIQLSGDFTMTPIYSKNLQDTYITNNGPYLSIEYPYYTDEYKYHDFTQHRFKNSNLGIVVASVKFEDTRILQTTDGYYITPHTPELKSSFKIRESYIHPINGSANNVYMGSGDYRVSTNNVTYVGVGGDKYILDPDSAYTQWFITPYAISADGTRHYGQMYSEYGGVLSYFSPSSYNYGLPFGGMAPQEEYTAKSIQYYAFRYLPPDGFPIFNTSISWYYHFGQVTLQNGTQIFSGKYNPVSDTSTVKYGTFPAGTYEQQTIADPGYEIGTGDYPVFPRTTELSYDFPLLKYKLGTSTNPGEDFYLQNKTVTITNQMTPNTTLTPGGAGSWVGSFTSQGGISFESINYSHNEGTYERRYTYQGITARPYSFTVNVVNTFGLVRPTDTISYFGIERVPDYVNLNYYGSVYAQQITSTMYGDADVPTNTYTYYVLRHVSNGVKTIQDVNYTITTTPATNRRFECTYINQNNQRVTVDITTKLADALRVFGPEEYDSYTNLELLNKIALMVMDVRLSRIQRFT